MRFDRDAEAIIRGDHGNPFSYLGPHDLGSGRQLVRAFAPGGQAIEVIDAAGNAAARSIDNRDGLFEIPLDGALQRPYRLRIHRDSGSEEIMDPYQFGSYLGEVDLYLLREGTHLQ